MTYLLSRGTAADDENVLVVDHKLEKNKNKKEIIHKFRVMKPKLATMFLVINHLFGFQVIKCPKI